MGQSTREKKKENKETEIMLKGPLPLWYNRGTYAAVRPEWKKKRAQLLREDSNDAAKKYTKKIREVPEWR